MIKFFRRIRQRLLSENKFRNYVLYAIGEIILVVIGILIALQINNWNEEQKTESKVQDYYVLLLEDLNSDTNFARTTIDEYSMDLNAGLSGAFQAEYDIKTPDLQHQYHRIAAEQRGDRADPV